jgi:hypothetical protein
MKKRLLTVVLLMLVAACSTGLGAQEFIAPKTKKPFHAWCGLQIGVFGSGGYGEDGLVGFGYDFSAQFGRKLYGSLYRLGGSAFLGDNDAIDEFGFMVGRCSRTKRFFAGAATGLGWLSGWLGRSVMKKEIGLPIKLEGALIIGRYAALVLQLHAFIWKHPYSGMSLGVQFGKMR